MEGRIVGVFGTDANAKAALLAPITKKSEAEGAIVELMSWFPGTAAIQRTPQS